ncbi:MAG: hypothetical protein K0R39_1585 [Symbiobacteriaceae bacterium]|jgi:uncharacterized protein (UPF0276 family)|nr:hypothetical protein [Symbiobacteriaceae bacterium]
MTQSGCNYSPALLDLLRNGEVDVDWIKLSLDEALEAEIELCRPFRPCLVHTLPRAGLAPAAFDAVDWARLSRAIVAAGSPHVAMHIETRKADRGSDDLVARMVRQMRVAAERLPVPVLGENVVYRKGSDILGMSAEADVICTVLQQTGLGLMLDTAHLRCSAYNQGWDAREYASALPLDRVREIHVAGIRRRPDGQLNDSHGEIEAADYELLAWLLERTAPQMVTLEYGGTGPIYERPGMSDPDALRRQLTRLKEMLS